MFRKLILIALTLRFRSDLSIPLDDAIRAITSALQAVDKRESTPGLIRSPNQLPHRGLSNGQANLDPRAASDRK